MICVHVLFVKKICMALRIRPWAHVSTWIEKIFHFHINWQCPSLSLSHELTRSLYRKFMSRPSTFTQSPALQFYLFSLFCVASTEILWIKPISGQENLRSKELHPKSEMQLAFWKQQRISDRAGRVIANQLWIFKSLELTFYCQTVMQHFEGGWKYVFM